MKHPFDLGTTDLDSLNLAAQDLTDEEAAKVTGGLQVGFPIPFIGFDVNFPILSIATTLAVGEEGGEVTTLAVGEEGGDFTTLAVGEEGGDSIS
ncbi:hypothetical protein [Nodularia sphaerocarpa]|uniref:hypothetical protein n=1 Tax=Nodularia sphaerocarpa TaxID=137816 RepID=UPI001EFAD43B|nr:hypothetical protein [Nodularia sphaerocarpa]MDB9373142.1 hypothetical protein [Nodularia sphaerocarpa CS-585]MDB9377489.1 hypothetical protein [Nodularia sphaerocarpa CS-585A2]ULP73275.1 hypothetical protein BDGGKGIB_02928 [Nodularia sphaerocarpa UHCC 0038]